MTGMLEQSFEQIRPSGSAVLDRGDGARESADVAGAKGRNQICVTVFQRFSVMQEAREST